MNIAIEKHWDGNEVETEGANGRIYVSKGRWQWVVVVNHVSDLAFDTKREAQARADTLRRDTTPPPVGTLYRAALDTRHFTFEAYGRTAADAKRVLRLAWALHVQQTGAADDLIDNDIRDLTPYPVRAGMAFRDDPSTPLIEERN